MNKIITATGKEIVCSFFGMVPRGVYYADVEADFITAFQIFSDPEETSMIKYIYDNDGEEATQTIKDFTALLSISNLQEKPESVRISMQRSFSDMEETT